MRVTIDHKEEAHGLRKRWYLVNVAIQFSEAERAIIKARSLQDNIIDISPGFLASTVVKTNPFYIKLAGVLCTLIGFFTPFFGRAYDPVFILFFPGILLIAYALYLERKLKKGQANFVAIKYFFKGMSYGIPRHKTNHHLAFHSHKHSRQTCRWCERL